MVVVSIFSVTIGGWGLAPDETRGINWGDLAYPPLFSELENGINLTVGETVG